MSQANYWRCSICNAAGPIAEPFAIAWANSGRGISLLRLKRIPPLAELEGEKREQEITA